MPEAVARTDASGVLHLVGQLDVRTVGAARAALHDALRARQVEGTDLVVDLSGLESLDASGLGVLVGAHRAALRTGRRLVLRGSRPATLRLFAVTRLHRVLHLERSRRGAAAV